MIILGSLLVAEELDGRVRNNTSTVSTIPFKQSTEAFGPPYILQSLNCPIVLYTVWILNLEDNTKPAN